ncbi:unnamed protein product [Angiostrongylus costaricensis]|uniref:Transposase n=1 Tax=Angiostrongylus costaricensis TaxID=334426 RepID=A0A0R3PD90_ANGCS|nr:unnamed protein product [Angiostrongylus costaricensis]
MDLHDVFYKTISQELIYELVRNGAALTNAPYNLKNWEMNVFWIGYETDHETLLVANSQPKREKSHTIKSTELSSNAVESLFG